MTKHIITLALLLLACGSSETIDGSTYEGGQSAGGEAPIGGAGGTGGAGGSAPECIPGEVCRPSADVCDAEEICDDTGECPRDSQAPMGSAPSGEGCGAYLCDGHHHGCPSTCSYDDDCVEGAACLDGVCE